MPRRLIVVLVVACLLVAGAAAWQPWARHAPARTTTLRVGLYENPPKGYTDAVLDDEFPLSMFFEALEKKMRPVIAGVAGIRATDA